MTKAQKKLKETMIDHGRESIAALTGLSVTTLYYYARSQEAADGMKMHTAVLLFQQLGIGLMEWFEEVDA